MYFNLHKETSIIQFFETAKSKLERYINWPEIPIDQPNQFTRSLVQELVDFFNRHNDLRADESSNKKFLLVLDNVEKIVQHDRRLFIDNFVNELLKQCWNLKIMVSTCELMERDLMGFIVEPKDIDVEELDNLSSVELFKKVALHGEEFSAKEVHNLVTAYPNDLDWSRVPQLDPEELENIFNLKYLQENQSKRCYVLAAHDLIEQLGGDPFSITQLASIYRSPFETKNDLKGLYERQKEILRMNSSYHSMSDIIVNDDKKKAMKR